MFNDFQASEAEEILLEKTKISTIHMQQLHKVVSELNKRLPTMVKRAIMVSALAGFVSGSISAVVVILILKS